MEDHGCVDASQYDALTYLGQRLKPEQTPRSYLGRRRSSGCRLLRGRSGHMIIMILCRCHDPQRVSNRMSEVTIVVSLFLRLFLPSPECARRNAPTTKYRGSHYAGMMAIFSSTGFSVDFRCHAVFRICETIVRSPGQGNFSFLLRGITPSSYSLALHGSGLLTARLVHAAALRTKPQG